MTIRIDNEFSIERSPYGSYLLKRQGKTAGRFSTEAAARKAVRDYRDERQPCDSGDDAGTFGFRGGMQ